MLNWFNIGLLSSCFISHELGDGLTILVGDAPYPILFQ